MNSLRVQAVRRALAAGDEALAGSSAAFDHLAETLQRKILRAFVRAGVSADQLGETTGYGYDDSGRKALEQVFAEAMDAEASLVRPQLVSGTHAIATALLALLKPGDTLLSATGRPYDTLWPVIGPGPGSLSSQGVEFVAVDPWAGGEGLFDLGAVAQALDRVRPSVVLVQRSKGYTPRPSLARSQLEAVCAAARSLVPPALVVVDNCYAEFVEPVEPGAMGSHLSCGSLIKNPGGGIAPAGGYVAGHENLIEAVAARLYAPGLGRDLGPSLVPTRLLLQGLFLAPGAVAAALKTAEYASAVFGAMGYAVSPAPREPRTDIIQGIRLEDRARVIAFCRAIQHSSPVDSRAAPEFAAVPGYSRRVIMAAGTFVQGASLELSADAPDCEPYWVYLQGGLGTGYGKAAVEAAAEAVGPHPALA